MAQQNIFDNEIFFSEYRKLREREVNANNLFEIPTLFSLMPDLAGRRVLEKIPPPKAALLLRPRLIPELMLCDYSQMRISAEHIFIINKRKKLVVDY